MSINIDTAVIINTLANAASQLATTAVGKRLEQVIDDLLPDSLTEEMKALRTSSAISAENTQVLRDKLAEILLIVTDLIPTIEDGDLKDDLKEILDLSQPIES